MEVTILKSCSGKFNEQDFRFNKGMECDIPTPLANMLINGELAVEKTGKKVIPNLFVQEVTNEQKIAVEVAAKDSAPAAAPAKSAEKPKPNKNHKRNV